MTSPIGSSPMSPKPYDPWDAGDQSDNLWLRSPLLSSKVADAPEYCWSPVPIASSAVSLRSPSEVGKRLDDFMQRATPTFQTPDGCVVQVPIGFFMNHPQLTPLDAHKRAVLGAVMQGLGLTAEQQAALRNGRGAPEQVAAVTQALINRGELEGPKTDPGEKRLTPPQRIRATMRSFGLGLDCAGYVQQAFLASRGSPSRASVGLKSPANENLVGLSARGFARLANVDQAAPGDLFILAADPPDALNPHPVGHTAIVRDVHPTTAEEVTWLQQKLGQSAPPELNTGRWTSFVVDSSWGSGGQPEQGGVERRTWWHDALSDKWIGIDDWGNGPRVAERPYGHGIDGVYRRP
jgi:hypothetical protein